MAQQDPVRFKKQIKNVIKRKQKAHKVYRNLNNQVNQAISSALSEYNEKTENEIRSCPRNCLKYKKKQKQI